MYYTCIATTFVRWNEFEIFYVLQVLHAPYIIRCSHCFVNESAVYSRTQKHTCIYTQT